MKERNYLILITLTAIILILSLIYLVVTVNVFTTEDDTAIEEIIMPEFEPIPEQTVNCKICHINPDKVKMHINGGNFCEPCHGTELHDLHIKETSVNLSCDICHGSEPVIIPEKLPEHPVVCDTCHNYPDPMQPSYGNLITIHMTRGYTCTICHIQDIQSIHIIATVNTTFD